MSIRESMVNDLVLGAKFAEVMPEYELTKTQALAALAYAAD